MERGPCGPFLFVWLSLWRMRATGSTNSRSEFGRRRRPEGVSAAGANQSPGASREAANQSPGASREISGLRYFDGARDDLVNLAGLNRVTARVLA
jgi:hypothetical protein